MSLTSTIYLYKTSRRSHRGPLPGRPPPAIPRGPRPPPGHPPPGTRAATPPPPAGDPPPRPPPRQVRLVQEDQMRKQSDLSVRRPVFLPRRTASIQHEEDEVRRSDDLPAAPHPLPP